MKHPAWHAGAILASAWLTVSVTAASARDNGQFADVPANVKSWFKSIKNRQGVPCCDISDGHILEGDDVSSRDDKYMVHIEGEWVAVPPEVVIYDHGNPNGGAVVWYYSYAHEGRKVIVVRCFVDGGGI